MNDGLAASSECSSGCESGWTLYLEHSFLSANPQPSIPIKDGKKSSFFDDDYTERRGKDEEEEEEEEDLSMVSDASSGPPHLQEDINQDRRYFANGYFNNEVCEAEYSPSFPGDGKRQLIRERCRHRRREENQEPPGNFLDDTASSPLVNFSNVSYIYIYTYII